MLFGELTPCPPCLTSGRVSNQGVQTGVDLDGVTWAVDQTLYRRFGTTSTELHTLKLIPSFNLNDEVSEETNTDSLLSPLGHAAAGVCCFMSHSRNGYMYSLGSSTLLLSDYTYKSEGCKATALNDYLLYVTTPEGCVDTYTIRNVLPGRVMDQIESLPAVSLVGTMGGIFRFSSTVTSLSHFDGSPAAIHVHDDTVVITTKLIDDRWCTSTSSCSRVSSGPETVCAYNVYVLEVVGILKLYEQVHSLVAIDV